MPGGKTYTVKAGDTLSKIAKREGLKSWEDIYHHADNAEFRKKRPDPDHIEPGDRVWIPAPPSSKLSAKVREKTHFVRKQGTLAVTEIRFGGERDIWYVRLDKKCADYVAPAAEFKCPDNHQHLAPVARRPDGQDPHWRLDAAKGKPEFNWPAVYVRDGTKSKPKRTIKASFRFEPAISGKLFIAAEGPEGIAVGEKEVAFKDGLANNVDFEFTKLPETVRKLSRMSLRWSFKKGAKEESAAGAVTTHTLYIVDNIPVPLNYDWSDKVIFEICDWACTWADGKKAPDTVLAAIWSQFSPVKATHATGLVYWKNYGRKVKPTDCIEDAIKILDAKKEKVRAAANCTVFDRVFICCLCLHGIAAAEIALAVNAQSRIGFDRSGKRYTCDAWMGTSCFGQGNQNGPPGWQSHWIADVITKSGWNLYDPSYGVQPKVSNPPAKGNTVDVLEYEFVGVDTYPCVQTATGDVDNHPAHKDASVLPHLFGMSLWTP